MRQLYRNKFIPNYEAGSAETWALGIFGTVKEDRYIVQEKMPKF